MKSRISFRQRLKQFIINLRPGLEVKDIDRFLSCFSLFIRLLSINNEVARL